MLIAVDASQVKVAGADGMSSYSYYLLRALSQLDNPHQLLFFFKEEPLPEVKKEFFEGRPAVNYQVLGNAPFWRQTALAAACMNSGADLLFVPGATLPVVRSPTLRTVVTVHDLCFDYLPEQSQFPQKLLLGRSVQCASYWASRVIAVSQATKGALVERFDVSADKISVVYEGVDSRKFEILNPKSETFRVRKKYGIGGDYVLFVGTIQPRKNLRRMIEAFSEVANSREFTQIYANKKEESPKETTQGWRNSGFNDLQLVIAGKPGWLFEDIYSAPKDFGVEDKVKFLGPVPDEDLPGLYRGAQVFLYPSLCEGFGLPILESMASETPVITSNLSSMPEVGGEAAFYVNPHSAKDIARGLQRVLTDDNLRQTLIASGKERAEEFSWQRTAKETLKVFEEAGKGRTRI